MNGMMEKATISHNKLSLLRVQTPAGTQHFYRRKNLLSAYRFARDVSFQTGQVIVLELVETTGGKSLEEHIQDVLCDGKPLFYIIKHLRYFDNGKVRKSSEE